LQNEFREKLIGINGCSVQELLSMRQFFITLLDFRNNDPVLLHCIKTVTHQIQRRQYHQHQQKDMAFHSYNNIDRLAKALASLQTRNDQVPTPVIQPQNSAPVSQMRLIKPSFIIGDLDFLGKGKQIQCIFGILQHY
jgi:hypothetical protein